VFIGNWRSTIFTSVFSAIFGEKPHSPEWGIIIMLYGNLRCFITSPLGKSLCLLPRTGRVVLPPANNHSLGPQLSVYQPHHTTCLITHELPNYPPAKLMVTRTNNPLAHMLAMQNQMRRLKMVFLIPSLIP
jgi:hypothetical protein